MGRASKRLRYWKRISSRRGFRRSNKRQRLGGRRRDAGRDRRTVRQSLPQLADRRRRGVVVSVHRCQAARYGSPVEWPWAREPRRQLAPAGDTALASENRLGRAAVTAEGPPGTRRLASNRTTRDR